MRQPTGKFSMLLALIFIISLVFSVNLELPVNAASTYYISPGGSDTNGNGSQSNPWKTLSHACSLVRTSGDTIYINAGTYNDSAVCDLAPGVNVTGAGKTVTTIISNISNDYYLNAISSSVINGNQTISGFKLDGSNRTLLSGIRIIGRNYVTIDNVDFVNISKGAIKLEGTEWWTNADQEYPPVPPPVYAVGCTLSNINITGCSGVFPEGASVWIQSVQDMLIENMKIDESAGTGGQGNAVKSWPGWVKHSTIRNSEFIVNPDNTEPMPLEIWNWETDCDVYGNTFREGYISLVSGRKNGGTWALKFHDNKLINTRPFGSAHELSVDDTDFYNNYIEGESLGVWAATHMYNLDGLSNVRVRGNVIYNTNGQGIIVQNGPGAVPFDNIQIYNNTIDRTNGSWPDAGICVSPNLSTNFTNLKIKNNIFTNLANGVYFYGNAGYVKSPQVTYNDFWNVSTDIRNDGVVTPDFSNNLYIDPQFEKVELRPGYYKLISASQLINRGTNVGLPYTGSAPDIGAYEYSAPVPTPTPTPEPGTTIVNDNTTGTANNQFNYVGSWTYNGSSSYNYLTDCHYSQTTNAYYEVKFYGTQVKMYTEFQANAGIVAVSVDGGPETLVDTYSPTHTGNTLAYTSPVLSTGQHTFKARVTGTKNGNSTGTWIVADRVDVIDNSPTTIINDNTTGTGNNQFEYAGSWAYSSSSSYNYQTDCHYSQTANDYYQVRFYGTQIKMYTEFQSNAGILAVSIDGGAETNIDTYSANHTGNTLAYTSPVLSAGQHTFKVRVTGTKNAASSGTWIVADRVDVINSSPTTVINDNTTGTGNNQFDYAGSWAYSGNSSYNYQTDCHFSETANEYYQVRFYGTQIKMYTEFQSNAGILAVSIDGGAETNIDTYSANHTGNTLAYTSPVLSAGQHTLKVRVTGTKNTSSSGYWIVADRVDVINN